MILVAESGSTKTDWRLITKSSTEQFYTIGFNPYHISSKEILNELEESKLVTIKEQIELVYFYAAGCSTTENKMLLSAPLMNFFENARVEVEHDLLAAARATCGKDKGMVGILGTGSNSCVFDGERITCNVRSLGYILGDYGGGVQIGKNFIRALLGGELDSNIEQAFQEKYGWKTDDILNAVYKQPLANKYLAQFSEFVAEHRSNDNIQELLRACFASFFCTNICKYPEHKSMPLHLVGSIANIYQAELKEVAAEFDVEIGKIVPHPINELVLFHG